MYRLRTFAPHVTLGIPRENGDENEEKGVRDMFVAFSSFCPMFYFSLINSSYTSVWSVSPSFPLPLVVTLLDNLLLSLPC